MSQFAQQVSRASSAVQAMAAFPLRSSEKEEELYLQLQARERELEVARREQAALARRLDEAQQHNDVLSTRLAAIESACRRLNIMRQVDEEHARYTGAHVRGNQEVIALKAQDIRIHGGSGAANRFAFGSDQLQQLIDQQVAGTAGTARSHGRRASLGHEMQANQELQAAAEDGRRREQLRLAAQVRQRAMDATANVKFDVLGNPIVERAAPTPTPTQESEAPNLFSGLGQPAGATARRFERSESDLKGDRHLANKAMWRGGAAAPTATLPETL
jgi:hypothetical protein